ncbi:2-keto-4-pentenoate hydratase/2-oxohepta-3-ene-1,7-dioic acid hydratase in catechol pathway [Silvibacterium bohemicum]|uniref:2-keto-4-pentenoate hydratase/2-oxohepta-3-ene-1,7-dioic acid hydratase in catechol pathway n=1 Tax=Silvibacterium bohemicum TaxID=1577686 RepID=A0A841JX90_9BACT|nr:fumarylacetoacetate hydrolase family protein [Silvibacterium bohemicum]MBB6143601.1 2-keto-4-pentenoate hydratase/2-oxohepta-3-ene-1,7-dioic acid hydratase in catechol pathway [Silvibacterium bohemicum]
MRFAAFNSGGQAGLAVAGRDGQFHGLLSGSANYPGPLDVLIQKGSDALAAAADVLAKGAAIDLDKVELLPPLSAPGKIICVGLNYVDHSIESGFTPPDYPTIFTRFTSSLLASGAPIIRPKVSTQLDYEGEMVAVIGKKGRHIAEADALGHVIAYSIFNDASVRDYQKKSPQWTIGKNFDSTGAFGPYLVTADELPPGGKGLRIQTRLNGTVVQDASTNDMIFSVAQLISILSEAITLSPGDIIVSGTPAGVGMARKPPLFMKHGDVCEVEIEGIGVLRNTIEDE